MTKKQPCVTIDGPAGAGKSTVSRRVADRLGFILLDTGALYRAVALAAQRRGVAWNDAAAVSEVARELARTDGIRFAKECEGSWSVELQGQPVTDAIRTQEIGQGASRVSAIPQVREALLEMQRGGARQGGAVLEGRDTGTVVLPDAEAKFFLTASVDVRAERRRAELASKGHSKSLEEVRHDVVERDKRDSSRAVAPLRPAEDAIIVDSSALTIDEVVDLIVAHVERLGAKGA